MHPEHCEPRGGYIEGVNRRLVGYSEEYLEASRIRFTPGVRDQEDDPTIYTSSKWTEAREEAEEMKPACAVTVEVPLTVEYTDEELAAMEVRQKVAAMEARLTNKLEPSAGLGLSLTEEDNTTTDTNEAVDLNWLDSFPMQYPHIPKFVETALETFPLTPQQTPQFKKLRSALKFSAALRLGR